MTLEEINKLDKRTKAYKEAIAAYEKELGENTVLHLSRYHPMYKLDIKATGSEILEKFYRIASEKLNYVYVGNINIRDYQNTRCASCGKTVIQRTGYVIENEGITESGDCKHCGKEIVYLER